MLSKNLITLTALGLSAYFSLATSTGGSSAAQPTTGTYYVLSDCVIPALEVVVTTTNSSIVSPPGLGFTAFGFPSNQISQSVIGPVAGVIRECTVTYGRDGSNDTETRWLYSCFDAGKYKCSIYVQPQ